MGPSPESRRSVERDCQLITAGRPVESAPRDHRGEVEIPGAADGHEIIARPEILVVLGDPARRARLHLGQKAMAVEIIRIAVIIGIIVEQS